MFADENSLIGKPKESSYFLIYTPVTSILDANRSIAFALLKHTNICKEIDIPKSLFSVSPVTDIGNLPIDSFTRNLSSASLLIDYLFFESVLMPLEELGLSKCAEDIEYLRSPDAIEDDEPPSLESARGFVKLMKDFLDLGEPLLGLFPEGTLSVEWRIADDKHLLIELFDSEQACFAFIGPSTKGGEKFRLNGRGSIADVIRTLRKEGVSQWKNT